MKLRFLLPAVLAMAPSLVNAEEVALSANRGGGVHPAFANSEVIHPLAAAQSVQSAGNVGLTGAGTPGFSSGAGVIPPDKGGLY